jgi:conjugative relaxase-like TrwC/TraI family protein
MVSKAVCVSVQGAVRYFEVHLNVADYFVEAEKVNRGQFIGKVAERLGLDEKPITREKFVAFAQCDTVALGADSKRQRVSEIKYIEFCYSPPKAISVVAAVDGRVKVELDEAVRQELRWFETLVTVRDRRGKLANEEVTKPTGQMIAALFPHETSRTNDPDFHVHALIGNVTWDEERQGYFAIHYGQMLELRKTLDARIHNNLAARMGKLGYQVETAPAGFGLKEVPASVNAMFSERTKQVETVLTLLKRGYTPGQIKTLFKGVREDEKRQMLAEGEEKLRERMGKPSARPSLEVAFQMREEAVLLSRPKKVLISSRTLREDVARRLQKEGLAVEKPFPFPVKSTLDLNEAFRQGERIAFEKESVVRLDHLLGEIVRLAPGAVSNDELAARLRDDRHFLIRRMSDRELVTTRQVLNEEKTLLTDVIRGMGQCEPLQRYYVPPASLMATSERIHDLVTQARSRGEQLTKVQAEKWLGQFAAIHEYVCTSRDQFLNIRGGAGTGKTFCLEQLVGESQRAYRPVFICAPYGEQARVTLRNEAPRMEAAGHKEVAHAFAQANTVDSLLMRARNDPTLLRGADIYCDEAGLLDTPKALALVREAERARARVIFQGDTEQMAAVGRGQPIKLLQDELKLGMHVPRASISRRQLTVADKQLAADLSSGDAEKFAAAVRQMLDRGMIRQTPPDEAVEKVAREIVEARAVGKEIVAVSSVHRISEALAERIHDLHVEKKGREGQSAVDVHVRRDLQLAELRSSQFYKVGDVVEYKAEDGVVRAPIVAVQPNALMVEQDGQAHEIHYRQVRAVFDRRRIERGPGEKLLLQEKIRQGERIFEKGSRQTISRVSGGVIHCESGLRLRADDGRVRQGDCLTDYKAQGIKGAQVRGIEDNSSALAMGNKEAFHVKGTRHVQNLVLHVENRELYVEAIQRSNEKFSALQLERVPAPAVPMKSLLVDRTRLLLEVRDWGREFIKRTVGRKMREQIRHQLARFEALRPRRVEAVAEKITPEVKEAVHEKSVPKIAAAVEEAPKITPSRAPSPLETQREGLSSPGIEMAPKPQKKSSQSPRLQPRRPALQPKRSPYYHEPAARPRRGIGI